MRLQTEHIIQKIFSENSLEEVPIDRLRRMVDEHPYFALGHLLLAKKLQWISANEYEEQSERVSLYFNEPIWLQSLLHPADETKLKIPPRTEAEELADEEVKAEIEPIASEEIVEVNEQVKDEPGSVSTETVVESKENVAEEAPPIFEPYHTVDYFASQGIKISNEFKPTDRLGQQLKSFTEWLKTMKRLPETQVEGQLDEVTQQNVQEFAAHSLDEKDVITETMAEVLLKQNKEEEAMAIYEKLSLLNPSKRAYFAAKIEQLKGS